MLERIGEGQREEFIAFLLKNPDFNTYFLGDIAQFGLDNYLFQVYAERRRDKYIAAMFNLYGGVCFTTQTQDFNRFRFLMQLSNWQDKYSLSGVAGSLDRFADVLGYSSRSVFQFCKLTRDQFQPFDFDVLWSQGITCRWAGPDDAAKWCSLRARIDEFTTPYSVEGTRVSLKQKSWRTVLLEYDGLPLAAASITSEHALGGMIVSVMTRPDMRGRGFASACVSWLCEYLFSMNKFVCLFYDNPAAAGVYERLGFTTIGLWERIVF